MISGTVACSSSGADFGLVMSAMTHHARLFSIPSLGDGVMLGTAWIDRPVDTQGLRSLLPRLSKRSMEARPCSSE